MHFAPQLVRVAPKVFVLKGSLKAIGATTFSLETGARTFGPVDGCRIEIRLQDEGYQLPVIGTYTLNSERRPQCDDHAGRRFRPGRQDRRRPGPQDRHEPGPGHVLVQGPALHGLPSTSCRTTRMMPRSRYRTGSAGRAKAWGRSRISSISDGKTPAAGRHHADCRPALPAEDLHADA